MDCEGINENNKLILPDQRLMVIQKIILPSDNYQILIRKIKRLSI